SLPAMLRNNYSPSLATGTIAASGTLGQIIPPSIVLIILADQLAAATDQASTSRKLLYKENTGELTMPSAFDVASTSAGEMFLGAFVPGLVLVALYMLFILVYAVMRPKVAPAVHYEGKFDAKFWGNVLLILVPPLTLIFLVLGSIISGIATVNQAGAIGAAGALLMAGYRLTAGQKGAFYPAILAIGSLVMIGLVIANYEMNVKAANSPEDFRGIWLGVIGATGLIVSLIWSAWRALNIEDTLRGVMLETAKTTSLVFIILLGAAMLTAAFRAFGGEELVRDFLNSLPGGFWSKFIIVMAVIFLLGFFLDFIEIAVVVVPIVAPILLADPSANITAVWLGVMIGLNVQTSFLTPPFGFALFYLRGVAPAIVKTVQMYKGVVPFIALQLLALAIVGAYPQLVNYLPNRVSMLSETAPPPRNPKLQECLEHHTFKYFAENSDALQTLVSDTREIDVSALPKDLTKKFDTAIDQIEQAPTLLGEAFAARENVDEASPAYRVEHTAVRDIERGMRAIDQKIEQLKRADRLDDIESLESEKSALGETIPASWADTQNSYAELLGIERKARTEYRRNSDNAYENVRIVLATLQSTEGFIELEGDLDSMSQRVEANPENKELIDELSALSKRFGDLEGAGKIKSEIGKVRRAIKSKTPKVDKALKSMSKAVELYAEQKSWRLASVDLLPKIAEVEASIRDTVGLRSQRRMPRET
ncbi:MAG: TRAP transporter large permease subunit, partial [Pseudomonadota bacterium]